MNLLQERMKMKMRRENKQFKLWFRICINIPIFLMQCHMEKFI